jgi:hypothetical protein
LCSDKKPQQKTPKKKKNSQLIIHEEKTITPDAKIPEGSCFKSYIHHLPQDTGFQQVIISF